MDENRDDWTAARAYSLWEQAGRPFGQDERHWAQAVLERNLLERTRASSDGAEVITRARQIARSGLGAKRSILIVEDEPQLRYNFVDFFDEAGHKTFEAGNADEALVHLRNNVIDILFTDVDMPGSLDGLGLAAQTRVKWPEIKIIVTSGLIALPHFDEALGISFIAKPASAFELLDLFTTDK
ncbi:response regulator [Rhizobium sp. 2MFCol3.1]|uniref:response regulator n=1 Tax=Rhizobium sp. 2MFCol3.1 TaxID=1246459 RepID=UPI0003653D35|nr:response regulator [Rhizobium sp. 2MFCol3.1]